MTVSLTVSLELLCHHNLFNAAFVTTASQINYGGTVMILSLLYYPQMVSNNITVFLLKIQHLLFFGTLSLKCVLSLQISASALVLRHSKPTARREKFLYFMEKSCRHVLVQNTCSSPHLQLFGAYGTSATIITSKYWVSKSEIIYFAPNF